jgi:hypothetical protein
LLQRRLKTLIAPTRALHRAICGWRCGQGAGILNLKPARVGGFDRLKIATSQREVPWLEEC